MGSSYQNLLRKRVYATFVLHYSFYLPVAMHGHDPSYTIRTQQNDTYAIEYHALPLVQTHLRVLLLGFALGDHVSKAHTPFQV